MSGGSASIRSGLTGPETTYVEVEDVLASTREGVGMVGEGVSDTVSLQPIVTVFGQVEMQGRGVFTRCVASALGNAPSATSAIGKGGTH